MVETGDLERTITALERRSRWLSAARLACFVAFGLGLFGEGTTRWIVSGGGAVLFVVFVVRHERVLRKTARHRGRRTLEQESARRRTTRRGTRAAPEWREHATAVERGERIHAEEPRSRALDPGVVDDLGLIGGPGTLFSFLDVSSTIFGARRLRRFLERPLLDVAAIRSRQELVVELGSHDDLRRELLDTLLPLRSRDFTAVTRFLAEKPAFESARGLLLAAHILGSLPLLFLVLAAFAGLQYIGLAVLAALFNMAFVGALQRRATPVRERVVLFGPLLESLLEVGTRLEGVRFESTEGRALVDAFRGRASLFQRLLARVRWLNLHAYGPLFEFFNYLTLYELRVLPGAERLLVSRKDDLEAGMGALGDLEALLSLAGPLAEQDGFVMAEVRDGERASVRAVGLEHPLLEPGVAVGNSFEIGRNHHVMLLTGSNMAGKSTFLKAVGVNHVLAQAGAPVAAQEFECVPAVLFTDIHVQDSLGKGKSYFQVEVERVRDIVEAASDGGPVLAILDELFRGTNSAERLAISSAIVRHLRDRAVLTLVATHDLRLTELVTRDGEAGMANYHFEESVVDGRMRFDYVLREGPAQTRNAVRVLELSGYPPEVIEEARERVGEG